LKAYSVIILGAALVQINEISLGFDTNTGAFIAGLYCSSHIWLSGY
jgi:hypothetical protein